VALEPRTGRDEQLAHVRTRRGGDVAHVLLVDRNVAPAEDALALDADVHLEQLLDLLAARGIRGQEALDDAVVAHRRQVEADGRAQERVGDLDEDPGAVARADVRALGTAVLEVVQRHQRAVHDLVRRLVVQPRDHGHAAAIVLEPRVVETVCLRRLVMHGHERSRGRRRGGRGKGAGSVADDPAERGARRVGVHGPEH
jgi:hypothetical protein